MSHRLILIQSDNIEDQYRLSMEWLDNKYHNYPTRLKPIPPTDDAWYNNYAPHDRQQNSKPLGKTVL